MSGLAVDFGGGGFAGPDPWPHMARLIAGAESVVDADAARVLFAAFDLDREVLHVARQLPRDTPWRPWPTPFEEHMEQTMSNPGTTHITPVPDLTGADHTDPTAAPGIEAAFEVIDRGEACDCKRVQTAARRARELGAGGRSTAGAQQRDYDPKEVRAWAKAEGLDCPKRGQIPRRVLDAYRNAAARRTA